MCTRWVHLASTLVSVCVLYVPDVTGREPGASKLAGGLMGEYFNGPGQNGMPVLVRIDPVINFDWGNDAPVPA